MAHRVKLTPGGVRRVSEEGGCGVIGCAASEAIAGHHLIGPLRQMNNRGNGKGGGIAAAGCFEELKDAYALHIGYLDAAVRPTLEENFIKPLFDVLHEESQPELADYREVDGLTIRPPAVRRYFVNVREDKLREYMLDAGIKDPVAAEQCMVYENSNAINRSFYVDEPRAFVLSHAKNLMVLKGVAFAEQVALFYKLDDFKANVWIGHQRYPTRGRVWHPGGAHPFVGLNEALVHNGDFANYHSVREYLMQRGMEPLFLTDTEVAALLFDYYDRVLGYSLEQTIEALAPTSERDFQLLSKQRQRLYQALRAAHIHGSPDGPWFFIIARSFPSIDELELIGITDTSMLRPHVFSLSGGSFPIGCVASERQAIDALLESLAADDPRVSPVPEEHWSCRGGSYVDGGAYRFTLGAPEAERPEFRPMVCHDKFGKLVEPLGDRSDWAQPVTVAGNVASGASKKEAGELVERYRAGSVDDLLDGAGKLLPAHGYVGLRALVGAFHELGESSSRLALSGLTALRDWPKNIGQLKRSWVEATIREGIAQLLDGVGANGNDADGWLRIGWDNRGDLPVAQSSAPLVIDGRGFPPEGNDNLSRLIVEASDKGYRNFILYRLSGDRFIGCGLGGDSKGIRIDTYGSAGDYLGSGIDGAEIYVHGDAQDQVGQILSSGKIVIFGNVGQAFLYGAKGGEAFVRGNTAGRPLINSVGKIRCIVNGTCLDYAAESFMAGEETGGGFLLINGIRSNEHGEIMGLEERYPGGNFFSLASGGAGYINDPHRTLSEDQLNGAKFVTFTQEDWNVILPYLKTNEETFGFSIERDLLTVDRTRRWPDEIFRKVVAKPIAVQGVSHG